MSKLKKIAAYCAANIEDYEVRVQLALKKIDRMRCPLWMADEELANEIRNCAEEWAEENGYDVDSVAEIDEEDIAFCETN